MKLLLTLWVYLLAAAFGLCCFGQNSNLLQDSSFSFSSPLAPIDLKRLPQLKSFSANTRRFPFGITTEYCCMVLKLQNSIASNYILTINNTSLDTILIYRIWPGNASQLMYSGGNLIYYDSRRNSVWHNVQVKVEPMPSYYLIVAKAIGQNVNVDYAIVSVSEFQRWYKSLDRLVFFYAGFIFLICIISLTGSLIYKQATLLIYTGYVLSLAGWILAHYGYLFPEIYPSFPRLNLVIKQIASLIAMFCLLNLVTFSFKVNLQKQWLRSYFVLKAFTALLVIFYILYLTKTFGVYNPVFVNLIWNVWLLTCVCFILITLTTLTKTNRTARFFTIAISMVSLMAIYQSISNMGWLYNYFLNEHGMTVASLLEVFLLASGIFYNLWDERKNKELELKAVESERTRTLQMLIGVQEDERKRIASDLHDSIGPMLAALKINFLRLARAKAEKKDVEELATKTESIIDESITEIRDISHRLMPKGLSSKGLITLLSDYFSALETTHGIRVNFEHDINVALDKDMQLNLYRMISELSLNAAKHSSAERLCVSLKTFSDNTFVEIKDNGTGFVKGSKVNSSLGLKNVQSRVDYLGGGMTINSGKNNGTTIEISIPHKI